MAGLQRSGETFRRSGSSGLVWEDRFLAGDQVDQSKKAEEGEEFRELRPSHSVGATAGMMLERSHSNGRKMERSHSNGGRGYRTARVFSPALDPPSPKLSGCGFCGIFGKPTHSNRRRPTRR